MPTSHHTLLPNTTTRPPNPSTLILDRLSSHTRILSLPSAHIASISDIKFLGETSLVSADVLGGLCLWNYHKPCSSVTAQWSGHSDCINCIAVDPSSNSREFVTAGNDKVLRLWDADRATGLLNGEDRSLRNAMAVQEFHGHDSFVASIDIAASPNGSPLIASVSLDSTIRLWHPTCPTSVFSAIIPTAAASVRFVKGECYLLITSGPDGVFLWDIRTHTTYKLAVAPPPTTPYLDPVWDKTPPQSHTRPRPSYPATPNATTPTSRIPTTSSPMLSPPFTPSSYSTPRTSVRHSSTSNTSTPNMPYSVWQISSPAPIHQTRTRESSERLSALAQFQSKNTTINQKIFDKSTKRYVQLFSGHNNPPYAAISSHMGRHVITASKDNKIKLWDIPTQKGMFTFDGCSLDSRPVPCLSSDDRTLICGSASGTIHFWDTFSGADETSDNSIRAAPTHNHPITCISLSSDDITLASGDESGSIKLRTANDSILFQYKDPD